MQPQTDGRRLTTAEAAMVSALAPFAVLAVGAYLLDLAGLRFAPATMGVLAMAAVVVSAAWLRRQAIPAPTDARLLLLVVASLLAWLLWLAAPTMLPLSTGPDLTHHLLLIRYIEEHWRLVHDPALERYLGEMAQYTPGSHVLAALGGAWSGTDGLRALHPLQSLTVALKGGFLLLICLRALPPRAPRVLAAAGVALTLAAPRYLLGGFTEYGFLAQVVAELFVVAMWWAIVAWNDRPAVAPLLVFGAAGAAAFLTWPVYVGPPALAAFIVIAGRTGQSLAFRARAFATAVLPIGVIATVYVVGRLGWLQLAGTGGAAPWPSVSAYSAPLLALAVVGLVMALARPRTRATPVFLIAVLAQAAAFYAVARRAGAPQPYMALKMGYLILWPMAACGVFALGRLWTRICERTVLARALPTRARPAMAWTLLAVTLLLAARPLARSPRLLHPLPPATSLPLYDAGRWARANLPAACIEYLVGDDETAYWLHLAVLGNPRMSARTGDNSTYEPKDAIVRWLTPGGLPYAVVDLSALPRDVRDELDVVRRFDTAAIARRRGPARCDERR